MRVAAVIVTWNGELWIRRCLESLARQEIRPGVVIVDNDSSDHTLDVIEEVRHTAFAGDSRLHIVHVGSNVGFTSGANRGIETVNQRLSGVELVLLLNQDTFLEEDCLAALVEAARQNPRAGAFGVKTLYPDSGTIQHAGGYLSLPRMVGLHYGHHSPEEPGAFDELREVDYVTGAAMALRSSALAEVGPFNEVFSPGYYEDAELCDRLRAGGWSVLFVPSARAIHPESSSFSDRDTRLRLAQRNRYLFALPRLADEDFRRRFEAAELEFMEVEAHFDEVRAIRSGVLEVLSGLPALASRRLEAHPSPPDLIREAARLLGRVATASGKILFTRLRSGRPGSPETG
jgi:GT2 family glycosyltransferase